MKKILISIIAIFLSVHVMAQETLSFPFQGGKPVMNQFFKDSLMVSHEIVRQKATGVVVFKFTADQQGRISKIIIYYADDQMLAGPVIDALKKSNHKWIIPDHEKFHDFILPFSFNFNPAATETASIRKAVYNYHLNRKPITANDQVPLDMATLLPMVMANYDITE
jgi:hypothetical protein